MNSRKQTLWKGLLVAAALAIATQSACRQSDGEQQTIAPLELTSPSFSNGAIPSRYACGGPDVSPALAWRAPPSRTQSFALIVTDEDSPLGAALGFFVHWLLYNLPANKRELSENVPAQGQLPDGSRQGRNDFGALGYGGPCPPGTSSHRYVFQLYALDSQLDLAPGADAKQLRKGMETHILAKGVIIARYSRQ